jgi:hypothetical protein
MITIQFESQRLKQIEDIMGSKSQEEASPSQNELG